MEWPDLDSHLNLVDDPFLGAELAGDCLRPSLLPGLGVRWAPGAGPSGTEIPSATADVNGAQATRAKAPGASGLGAKAGGAKLPGPKIDGSKLADSKAAGGRRPAGGTAKSNHKGKAQAPGPEA